VSGSVAALLASPLTAGMFAGAIVESGPYSNFAELRAPQAAFGIGAAVADGATFLSKTPCAAATDVLACLRGLTISELMTAQIATPFWSGRGIPLPIFRPIVDGYVLDQPVADALAAGRADVPLIVGSNRDETASYSEVANLFPDDATYLAALQQSLGTTVGTEVHDLYSVAEYGSLNTAVIQLFGDVTFNCDALKMAQLASPGRPAFLYELDRGPATGSLAHLAYHAWDVPYVWDNFGAFNYSPTPADRQLQSLIQKAWGTMVDAGAPATDPPWPAFDATGNYLALDAPAHVASNYRKGKCASLRAWGVIP
jgi:para-nitrobenzyl esterase